MKVYVINLAKDAERLAAVDSQLRRLGVAYERVDAIYAKSLDLQVKRAAVNRFRWWCAMGRRIRTGEIGCALSHRKVYRQMMDEELPLACILEDDVILDDRFPVLLERIESVYDSNSRDVVLLSNHTSEKWIAKAGESWALSRTNCDMYTEGYVIGLKAAQVLVDLNWPMQVPCDHWGRWVKLGAIKLYHAFPTVCGQDQTQYVSRTVTEGAFDVRHLSSAALVWYKFKRAIGLAIDNLLLNVEHQRSPC